MGIQRRLEAGEDVGLAEVGHLTTGAQQAVGELVVGGHLAAGRHHQRDVVGQRPVVADVEGAPPDGQGVAIDGHRQLGLARAGGAGDAQPEGLAVDAPGPLCQPAGEAGGQAVGLADHRVHLGHQLQDVAQEALDPGPAGEPRPLGRQDAADDRDQVGPPAEIHDARRVDARAARLLDHVVGAVQQRFDLDGIKAAHRTQPGREVVGMPGELQRHALVPPAGALGEAARRLGEEAGLLFDQQQLAGGADNGEVDLAGDREAALGDPRPVHAVVHGVLGRQPIGQQGEGFDLTLGGTAGLQLAPAVGMDEGHVGRMFGLELMRNMT